MDDSLPSTNSTTGHPLALTSERLWFLYTLVGCIKTEIEQLTGWRRTQIDAGLRRWNLQSTSWLSILTRHHRLWPRTIALRLGIAIPDTSSSDQIRERLHEYVTQHLRQGNINWPVIDAFVAEAVRVLLTDTNSYDETALLPEARPSTPWPKELQRQWRHQHALMRAAQLDPLPTPTGYTQRDEANVLTLYAFRNSFLEDIHAGYSGFSDEEMKKLMIETSAQLATALYLRRIAPDYHHQFLEAHRRFSCGDWDREATVYQLPASPRIACPRCEKDVQTRWRFCPSCGLSVEKK